MTNSNTGLTVADLLRDVAALGKESALSALAKPKMGLTIADAAFKGIITAVDAEATYEAYLKGRTKALSSSALGAGDATAGSIKANVSKNKQIIDAAMLPKVDFCATLDRLIILREQMVSADEKVIDAFSAFVEAARTQKNQPDYDLDEDQIMAACRKADPKDKSLVELLIQDYKRIAGRIEKDCGGKSGPLEVALDAIGTAIVEAGGEVPPLTKEEIKAAEAMAFLKSIGKL
jgi:hypothetical protein